VRAGLDCIGLLVLAHQDAGLELKDCTTYARRPNPAQLLHHIERNFDEIPLDEAGPGDALVFWFQRPNRPMHVALLTDYGMVHTWSQVARGRGEQGKVVETGFPEAWRKRRHSAWRHPERED